MQNGTLDLKDLVYLDLVEKDLELQLHQTLEEIK